MILTPSQTTVRGFLKIFDPKTGEWSKDSVNDRGLLNNFLGETLVYGQWDEDGVHDDLEYGVKVKHKKI